MFRIWSLTLILRGMRRCKWRIFYIGSCLFFIVFAILGILGGRDSWVTWLSLLSNGWITVTWTAKLLDEVTFRYWEQVHDLTGRYDQVLVFHILYPKLRQDPWFGGVGMQVWGFGSVYSRRKFE